MKRDVPFFMLYFALLIVFLTGCTLPQNNAGSPDIVKKSPTSYDEEKKYGKPPSPPIPLQLETGDQLERMYGWVDNQTILFAYTHEGEYLLATYQLYKGESKVIFSSPFPFNDVTIHNDKNLLLIQTSESAQSAELFFTDLEGKVKYSTSIESYEIAIEWNKNNSNLLLLTAFFEDWTYENMLIDIEDQSVRKMPDIAPFSKWLSNNQLVSQDWDLETPNVFAPLMKQSLSSVQKKEEILKEVYRYDVFWSGLMTIKVDHLEAEEMQYVFYDQSLRKIRTPIKVPNLTQYADWLIPNYDFSEAKKSFLTFVPKHHGNVDSYTENFSLIAYDLFNEKDEVILENMENKPISCSPDGNSCLYGYQLEEFINLETRERIKLSPLTIGRDKNKLITVT